MAVDPIKESYLENKERIINNPRLSNVEKDISLYKNWCNYINDYTLKLKANKNIKVY